MGIGMEKKTNDAGRLQLPNVTLAAMTSVKIYETVRALTYSMQGIDFGQVVLITHRKPFGRSCGHYLQAHVQTHGYRLF